MSNPEDVFFEKLAEIDSGTAPGLGPVPAQLKSKIYSALIRRQEESGSLASLSSTRASGGGLCVFEQLVEISPVPEAVKCFNCCSICHARILAEKLENAPIYWSHCPYVRFQNR